MSDHRKLFSLLDANDRQSREVAVSGQVAFTNLLESAPQERQLCWIMYQREDSVRNDVLVLFDADHSWIAMVMPEVLNPVSQCSARCR